MIDTTCVDVHEAMGEDKFNDIANSQKMLQKELQAKIELAHAQINVVKIPSRGWAIYGWAGVYEDAQGVRVFQDLAEVHNILRGLGVIFFMEDYSPKRFDL